MMANRIRLHDDKVTANQTCLYVMASFLPVSLFLVCMVESRVLKEGWPDFFCTD